MKPKKKIVFSFRPKSGVYEKLIFAAQKNERSLNSQINFYVTQGLQGDGVLTTEEK
ncbi:MAG: Arc family DNA-binding protein [Gammaproteobacteria bacterium]|nr:Arc family DNA-binding protein [Gammaproteobacteria bacterium]